MQKLFNTLAMLACAVVVFPAAAVQVVNSGGSSPSARAQFEKCMVYANGTKDVPAVPCKSVKTDPVRKAKTGADGTSATPSASADVKAAPLTLSNTRSR